MASKKKKKIKIDIKIKTSIYLYIGVFLSKKYSLNFFKGGFFMILFTIIGALVRGRICIRSRDLFIFL